MKLCLKSLKTNGLLIRNVGQILVPYDANALSKITNTDLDTVMIAMKLFEQIGLVKILENGEIYITQLEDMVGSETSKARIMRNKRAREREKINGVGNNVTKALPKSYIEIENRDKRIEKERINYQEIINLYNEVCTSFPKVMSISDKRRQAIKARLNKYSREDFKRLFEKAEESDFLKGSNSRNWQANFDWLIKDANMAKVLDGNYENREVIREKAQELDYSEGWD